MVVLAVVGLSILLQSMAAVLAVRLIRVTGWRMAWTLIAAASVLMVVRRAISFVVLIAGPAPGGASLGAELVACGASLLLMLGVAWIGPVLAVVRQGTEALRRSEAQFRALFDDAVDGLLVHDLNGRFVLANEAACTALGYSRAELLALSVRDLEVGFDLTRLPALWEDLLARGPQTIQGTHRRKDGSTFPVELRVGPFELAGRRLILAIVRDTTERRRAEAERERLIRDMEEALAKVKKLGGLLPICSVCKKVRDDKGYWNQIDEYIREHSTAEVSHSICPSCARKIYDTMV